ncbi:hypothetical protein [Egbenema bharatensis]|uniref:hypothetical protein n=1 Tax=Egbenema bharatensis TaxID=3463334 RepID=UPI003A83EC06
MSDKEALKMKMEECQDYKTIKQNRASLNQRSWFSKLLLSTLIATLIAISAQIFLSVNETKFGQKNWYETATVVTGKFVELLAVVWVVLGTDYAINKSRQ